MWGRGWGTSGATAYNSLTSILLAVDCCVLSRKSPESIPFHIERRSDGLLCQKARKTYTLNNLALVLRGCQRLWNPGWWLLSITWCCDDTSRFSQKRRWWQLWQWFHDLATTPFLCLSRLLAARLQPPLSPLHVLVALCDWLQEGMITEVSICMGLAAACWRWGQLSHIGGADPTPSIQRLLACCCICDARMPLDPTLCVRLKKQQFGEDPLQRLGISLGDSFPLTRPPAVSLHLQVTTVTILAHLFLWVPGSIGLSCSSDTCMCIQ